MKRQLSLLTLCAALLAVNTYATTAPAAHPTKINKTVFDEGTKARLTLGNKTYDLTSYTVSFTALDKNKPAETAPTGYPYFNAFNSLTVNIRSSKLDQELLDWLTNADGAQKEGQITVTDSESGKTLKTFAITGLRPSSYSDNYYGSNIYNQSTTSFTLRFTKVNIKL